jgi:hypothetical protein
MDHEVETSAERVRYHLRRPLAASRNLLMETAGNTLPVTVPWTSRAVVVESEDVLAFQGLILCCRAVVNDGGAHNTRHERERARAASSAPVPADHLD